MTPPQIAALQLGIGKVAEIKTDVQLAGTIAILEVAYQLAVRNEPWKDAEYNRGAGNMRDNIVDLILKNPTTDKNTSSTLVEIIKAIRQLPLPTR